MTVSTEVDHNEYTGNGVTTAFPYYFRIFKDSDLTVVTVDLGGSQKELTLGTDYVVTGAGTYQGGNVVLTSSLANNWKISITRELSVTQETDLRNQGKFFAEVHENAFDKLTMLIQQCFSWTRLALVKPSVVSNFYDAKNQFIKNLLTPLMRGDAANKGYIDDLYQYLMQTVNTIIDTIKNGLYGYNTKRSFELGNTINYPNDVLLFESDGEYYRWDGALSKKVPPGSTPDSTGGIGKGKWLSVGDATLRSDLASTDAGRGSALVGDEVDGSVAIALDRSRAGFQLTPIKKTQKASFSTGTIITDASYALFNAADGFYYKYTGLLPVIVPPASSPDSNWICVGMLNGYPINNIKSWVLDASQGNASATTSKINLMIASLIRLNIFSCHINEFSEVHINGALNFTVGMRIIGNGFYTNPIVYHGTGDAITYAAQIYIEGIYLKQGDAAWTGRAVVCTGQQSYCSFKDVNIEGFRYGHTVRYSIWIKYTNVRMRNVACGFRFLRNSSATDKNDPIATGTWNANGGWFHNVLDMSLVTIDGCEVGVWGTPMCAVMTAPTIQGVAARGVGTNLVLPDGIEPCAMYLQGGNTTPSTVGPSNWSLQINQLYIESANAGVLVEGYRLCKIGMFVQGGPSATRMKFAVKATSGSNVIVSECVGQDYFEYFFIANNQSTIEVQRRVGPMTGTFASGDGTGLITYKEQDKLYTLNSAAGTSGRKYAISTILNGMYELEVQGVVNGTSIVGGIFNVSVRGGGLWACAYTPLQPLTLNSAAPVYPDGKTSTPISVDVSGGNLWLIVGTGYSYSARILLRTKLTWDNSAPITIPDSPV